MASFKAKAAIWTNRPIAPISPLLHGCLVEHCGRTVSDGIWIEEGSGYSKVPGLRTELIDMLRRVKPSLLKWPGGHFADTYHWQDGIGPKKNRPRRRNLSWEGEETNQFGTDEFLRLCEKVVAAPYICLNVGTGSVQEALNWVEYCNAWGNTEYTRMRHQNGNPNPFQVVYWSVGNDPWGYGGSMDPNQYVDLFRHYATYLKQADPHVQLVACGRPTDDWNPILLENLQNHLYLVDHLSIHTAFWTAEFGGSNPRNESEYYGLFGYLPFLEAQILRTIQTLDERIPREKKLGIAVDEWGIWHPEAINENGLEQATTLRDGLMAGCTLHLFHRFAHRLSMANLAQAVNALHALIVTKKDAIVLTPTYHVFDLLQSHVDNLGLVTRVKSPKCKTRDGLGKRSHPLVDVSASLDEKSSRLIITLINLHIDREAEVTIHIKGRKTVEGGNAKLLTADSPNDQNSFEAPHHIQPQNVSITRIGNPVIQVLPPHSLAKLQMEIS